MRWVSAGVVLGIGLGGFIDGILLHQIVHWHNMGSTVLPPITMEAMSTNMRWDGLFHAGVWIVTLIGALMLWREGLGGTVDASARSLAGKLILGWGLFNLVEGTIDHQLLGLHHVRDVPVRVPAYDWAFLAIGGVGLIALGYTLAGREGKASPPHD